MAHFPDEDDLDLLELDLAASFVLSDAGRFARQNDPDHSRGPRVFLAGCSRGNVAAVRHDVDDRIAERILALAAREPPWDDPERRPACLDAIIGLLTTPAAPAQTLEPGLTYSLPSGAAYGHDAKIVRSGTRRGDVLLARLADAGMPTTLFDAGFVSVGDFWPPWCVALEGEDIAAMAFAARLGDRAAEVGVYTFPAYRGRGLAAAVTADWSAHPALARRTLFYSTQVSNHASRRVAARLGLRRIGVSLSIDLTPPFNWLGAGSARNADLWIDGGIAEFIFEVWRLAGCGFRRMLTTRRIGRMIDLGEPLIGDFDQFRDRRAVGHFLRQPQQCRNPLVSRTS